MHKHKKRPDEAGLQGLLPELVAKGGVKIAVDHGRRSTADISIGIQIAAKSSFYCLVVDGSDHDLYVIFYGGAGIGCLISDGGTSVILRSQAHRIDGLYTKGGRGIRISACNDGLVAEIIVDLQDHGLPGGGIEDAGDGEVAEHIAAHQPAGYRRGGIKIFSLAVDGSGHVVAAGAGIAFFTGYEGADERHEKDGLFHV